MITLVKLIRRVGLSKLEFTNEDERLQEIIAHQVHQKLGVKIDGIEHNQLYRTGRIDGLKRFFNKDGTFATGLLPQVDDVLKELQRVEPTLEIEYINEYPERWVEDEEFPENVVLPDDKLGEITLRDYQYRSVREAVLNQSGLIHVATNGGKCLTADTVILTDKGLVTVEDVFAEQGLKMDVEEKVVEYTGSMKFVNRYGDLEKPSHLTFNGLRPTFKITTSRGYTERATGNHPFLTVSDSGKFEWVDTKDLKEGMWIVSRKGDNIFGNHSMPSDVAYTLGAVVADGYVGQDSKVSFSNSQPEIIERVYQVFNKLGHTVIDSYKERVAKEVRLSDKEATIKFHKDYGVGYGVAKDKRVPKSVMRSDRDTQLAFLTGYLECEMSIEVPKCSIQVTSASHKLLQEIQMMLLNLGYVSNLSAKTVKGYEHNDYYSLTLGAKESARLLEELEFITLKRKERVDNFFTALSSRKRNDKTNPTPYGKELAHKYKEGYKNPPTGFSKKFTVPSTVSTSRFRTLVDKYPDGDKDTKAILDNLLNEDFVFSRVVSVEDAGVLPTYDVAMPNTHSFIANGMVNHNTEIGAGIFKTLIPQLEDGERMIFIVPTKEIFYGAQERLEMRLGQPIGLLGDGKRDIKQVTVVLMPTLVSSLKDPTKDVKITPKERKYQIMIDEVIPKFKGKKNLNTLIRNFLQGYPGTTKARSEIREELMELLHANLSDAKITMEFNKYETYFKKAMEKKAGKKYQKYLETLEFMDSVVCLICDETHRAKGDTWFDTIVQFKNAQYRIGMTGTIDKKDPMLTQKLQGLFGEVLERVANEELIGKGFSAKPYIKFVNVKEPRTISDIREYQSAYDNGIVHNEHRNQVIARMCKTVHDTNKTVLIIVNRLDHGENIREELEKLGVYSEFINGELATDVRKQQLADVKSGKLKVLIATTVLDEGVDISGIHCLILGAGGKSLRQTLQRVGRILRRKEDDNSALVIDFYDRTNMYLFNHSKERHKIYNEEGFDVDFLN